jgi:osmotically inducible protein OsmC
MDEEQFTKLANVAKENCPVSKALSAVPISLNISFSS